MENDDIILWAKDYFLKWSDFKASSNPSAFEDSSSKIKYHFTWLVNSEMQNEKIYFSIDDIKLSTQFLRHLSWAREGHLSPELLKHEQGHFDLAELTKSEITEKIQNKFNNKKFPTNGKNSEQQKQFARVESERMINHELEKGNQDLIQKRKQYSEETEFGQNKRKQKEYDIRFNELRK